MSLVPHAIFPGRDFGNRACRRRSAASVTTAAIGRTATIAATASQDAEAAELGGRVAAAGVGLPAPGAVDVNVNRPLTGWPSAEVTRQSTV
jgi:hypothetical protein